MLAWHKENARGKVAGFLWSAAIIVGGGSILAAVEGDPPLAWIQYWQLWVVVVVGSTLMSRPLTYISMSAGADWFQCQIVRFGVTVRKKHLDLYQLQKIKGTTGPAALYLELADASDFIDLARVYWQSDRRIWDLVYNGILHSVAAGAEVDRNARGFLELAQVPELRYPEGPRKIDVRNLSDVHVWELMEDPVVQTMCQGILTDGSAAEFRKLFPEFHEDMLANPANPEWFGTERTDSDEPNMRRD